MAQRIGRLLKGKWLTITSIVCFAVLLLLVVIHSYLNIQESKKMAQKYLVSITEGVTETVDCWMREQKNLLILISRTALVQNFLSDPEGTDISRFVDLIRKNQPHYISFFIADRDGNIRAGFPARTRADQPLNIRSAPFWDEFADNLFHVYVSPEIQRSPHNRKLTFYILTGVFDSRRECRGFIGASIDWDKFIEKFILPITVGQTGYVAITDEDGRNIGHPDKSLNLRNLSHLPWMQKIITEKNGFQQYHFQGIPKFMAYRQSSESGWIVNASVSEAELVEGPVYARNLMLVMGVGLLTVMLVIIGYIDIFRLGKAQKKMMDSQRKYKLLFNHGNDGIFVHALTPEGEAGRFDEVNDAFCSMMGITRDKLLDTSPGELLGLEVTGGYPSILVEVEARKYWMGEASRRQHQDDRPQHLELRLFLLVADGRRFVLGFMRDISERVRSQARLESRREELDLKVRERTKELTAANLELRRQIHEREYVEKALRESEEKYRNLVVRANDGIIVIQDEIIKFANDKMTEILRYSNEELVGMKVMDIVHEPVRRSILARYKRRIRGKRVDPIYETRFVDRDGHVVDVEINAGIINFEGRPADFIFVRDITERKKMEEEKQRHQEELIQTDKLVALGTLVSGVAHEINNPNNAIMLNAPILEDAWKNVLPILEEYRRNYGDFMIAGMPYSIFRDYLVDIIGDIEKCSGRIKTIVEDLKSFVRPSHAELSDEVDINQMVRSSINLTSNLIMKSTRNFHVDYGRDIPPVRGSIQRLEQVMVNLIQNACQALPDSSRGLTITTAYAREREQVEIVVADEGQGIPPENLSKIMDPFFTTKRSKGGTGLGLSVSSSLIKKHGGSLTFESEVDRGTRAMVHLPVKTAVREMQS
jgi:PAS domain S-box-containing protein